MVSAAEVATQSRLGAPATAPEPGAASADTGPVSGTTAVAIGRRPVATVTRVAEITREVEER